MAKIDMMFDVSGGSTNGKSGTVTANTSTYTQVNCGFVPTKIFTYLSKTGGYTLTRERDFVSDKLYQCSSSVFRDDISQYKDYYRTTSDGFEVKAINSDDNGSLQYYIAVKE